MSEAVIEAKDLAKSYRASGRPVEALRGVTLSIARGSMTFLVGPSGSGKSTFLQLAGGLDRPTSGTIAVDGRDLGSMDDRALSAFRRTRVGFVFQAFNLIPNLDAVDNVLIPFYASGLAAGMRDRARTLLGEVGLGDRLGHRPKQLSGGEQQRVAIARALLKDPALLLADEPTGELDSKTGAAIFALLRGLQRDRGASVVVVTHDTRHIEPGDRIVRIADGAVVGDSPA
ncbi:MAG: ABC transporter ATP-binding protein [Candidatus Brocadiae bacterium]|nr:ABC transporter ATP-binding protein [Candidatus Brocadiia bacterium]